MKRYSTIFNKFLFALIGLLIATSCEELLKEEPYNQLGTEFFYQNESDALAALTGAYAQLKDGNGYYRQIWLSNLHAASDQGASSWQHGAFRTGTVANTDANLPAVWAQIYVAIRDANNVIANVPGISNMDEDLKNRILGEARFLRGLHYLNLVRAFGEVPLRTTPIDPENNEGLPLSDIVSVYDVIIEDLEFAAANCWGREEVRNGYINDLGRVTDAAAHGLLAKAYLHIASAKRTALEGIDGNRRYLSFPEDPAYYYGKVVQHTDSVIQSSGFLLSGSLEEYKTIFDASNGNNPEMLFDIQGSSLTEQGTALSNLFSPQDAGLSGGGWGGTNRLLPRFISNSLDIYDPRFDLTVIKGYRDNTINYEMNTTKTGYFRSRLTSGESISTLWVVFTGKYIDRNATTEYTSQQNWHVIRLADVHLMRAEALVELNQDPSLADQDFNLLRNRVGMQTFDGSVFTMDQFRTALLRERAAELYMEGHRFFDLTRMGVYNDYCLVTYDLPDGIRGAEDYVWPIPLSEISTNNSVD